MFVNFRRSWGAWILVLSMIGAFIALGIKPVGGHYHSFAGAARLAWAGSNPFGIPFAGGIFFYSPAAAYFYGLFAFLPDSLGQFLYVAFGTALFFWALFQLLAAVRDTLGYDITRAAGASLFWIMVSSEVTGAIGAMKLEIWLAGFSMWAFALLLRGHHPALAGALLGIGSQWKFQPIPLFGLALVVLLWDRAWKRFVAGYLGMIAVLAAMPLVLLPWATVVEWYAKWWQVLAHYTDKAWLAPIYQHVFRFTHVWGFTPTRSQANFFTVSVALGLAVGLGVWCSRRGRGKPVLEGLLAALALGSLFITTLSPHTQSNGYILYLPALPAVWYFAVRRASHVKAVLGLIAVCYFFISISYSDLVPRDFYHWVYDHALKPVAAWALAALLVRGMLKARAA